MKGIRKRGRPVKLKVGDVVQVWDEKGMVCLGWGAIVEFVMDAKSMKLVAVVEIKGAKVWGIGLRLIREDRVFKINKRLLKDLERVK